MEVEMVYFSNKGHRVWNKAYEHFHYGWYFMCFSPFIAVQIATNPIQFKIPQSSAAKDCQLTSMQNDPT